MAKEGKLIVIDGTDGSGKATQVALLARRLRREGRKVKTIDFSQYYANFFGAFIAHCLREQYYNFIKVHPKIASVIYAADRFESKEKIEKWLHDGNMVISNRYVSANQIHQGGKIESTAKRKEFLKWLDKMEYGVFKIPRPYKIFYLNIPFSVSMNLINKRASNKIKRPYLKGKKDVAERNPKYMKNSRKSALWLAHSQKNWIKIECIKSGGLLPPKQIHEMIYEKIKKVLK